MIYSDGIHIVSDSSMEELHQFCQKVGIGRHWFHRGSKHPHYDIPKTMRSTFFEKTGLKKVSSKEIIRALKRLK